MCLLLWDFSFLCVCEEGFILANAACGMHECSCCRKTCDVLLSVLFSASASLYTGLTPRAPFAFIFLSGTLAVRPAGWSSFRSGVSASAGTFRSRTREKTCRQTWWCANARVKRYSLDECVRDKRCCISAYILFLSCNYKNKMFQEKRNTRPKTRQIWGEYILGTCAFSRRKCCDGGDDGICAALVICLDTTVSYHSIIVKPCPFCFPGRGCLCLSG